MTTFASEPSQIAAAQEFFADSSSVAGLQNSAIATMTSIELATVIRAAELPLLRVDVRERLDLYDRETLQRLAFLARRCCRNQQGLA